VILETGKDVLVAESAPYYCVGSKAPRWRGRTSVLSVAKRGFCKPRLKGSVTPSELVCFRHAENEDLTHFEQTKSVL